MSSEVTVLGTRHKIPRSLSVVACFLGLQDWMSVTMNEKPAKGNHRMGDSTGAGSAGQAPERARECSGSQSSGELPQRLAVQVLTKEITIDQGLVRALTGQVVKPFVEALNEALGSPCFDPDQLLGRVRSGDSQRAVDGKLGPLELPSHLPERPALPERDEYTAVKAILDRLEKRLGDLASDQEESLGRFYLLEAAERNAPRPPDPWTGPVLIMVVAGGMATFFFYFTSQFLAQYLIGATGFLGLMLAVLAFIKGYGEYARVKRRQDAESEQRRLKMESFREKIRAYEDAIWNVRKTGQMTLENASTLTPDQSQELVESHPEVFHRSESVYETPSASEEAPPPA